MCDHKALNQLTPFFAWGWFDVQLDTEMNQLALDTVAIAKDTVSIVALDPNLVTFLALDTASFVKDAS